MPKVSIQRFNRKWVTRAPVDWQKYRKRFHAHEKIIILEKSGGGGGGGGGGEACGPPILPYLCE